MNPTEWEELTEYLRPPPQHHFDFYAHADGVEVSWEYGRNRFTFRIPCSELVSLIRTNWIDRQPTSFCFGLLADYLFDNAERLSGLLPVSPELAKAAILFWRDWCRTQFERSQQ